MKFWRLHIDIGEVVYWGVIGGLGVVTVYFGFFS